MAARISAKDLPAETRKRLKIKLPRQTTFTKDAVRRHAIRVLAVVAELTQDQRKRVLQHALTVNEV